MYFNGFYWFSKEFLEIFENCSIFGPKTANFHDFRVLFLIVNFLRKMYLVSGKCSNQSNFWYTHAQRYPLKMFVCRVLIFASKLSFWWFCAPWGAIFAIFWRKKLKICPRRAQNHQKLNFKAKNQNSPN